MHPVQDMIIAVGSIIFIVAFVPTIRGKEKPPLSTSVATATVLLTFAGVYISLRLWFSAATTFGSAVTWLIVVFQKYQQNHHQLK